MKTNAIVRVVLYSLAIVILTGILTTALLDNQYTYLDFGQQDDTTEPVERINKEYFTAEIRNIEIEWVAGIITLQADQNATEISIIEHTLVNYEHQMVCKQSGQTLKIQFSEESFDFPSFGVNVDIRKDLVIIIPADWECNSLEIDTAEAKVILNNLTIQEFDFDGASGECSMTNCDVGELDIDTASGNVYFTGTLETLDCDAVSADCSIEVTNIPRSIEVDAMSGDLKLILPPSAGFTCTLDSMSNNFDTDFEYEKLGDQYICKDGTCMIKVSALSGDVSILKGIE